MWRSWQDKSHLMRMSGLFHCKLWHKNPEFKKVTKMGGGTFAASLNSMCAMGFSLKILGQTVSSGLQFRVWVCFSIPGHSSTQEEIFMAGKRNLPCCVCVLYAVSESGIKQEESMSGIGYFRSWGLIEISFWALEQCCLWCCSEGKQDLVVHSSDFHRQASWWEAFCNQLTTLSFLKDIPPFSSGHVPTLDRTSSKLCSKWKWKGSLLMTGLGVDL